MTNFFSGIKNSLNKLGNKIQTAYEDHNPLQKLHIFTINSRNYRLVKQFGEGGYSYVYLVEDELSGQKFALKKLLLGDSQSVKACRNEIDIMLKLKNHKNIVKLVDHAIFTNNKGETEANLLMEFCSSKFFFIKEKNYWI